MSEGKTIKPPASQAAYTKQAIGVAFACCPPIRPCKKCGWAVADGYCCGTCGDASPDTTREQDAEWEAKHDGKRR